MTHRPGFAGAFVLAGIMLLSGGCTLLRTEIGKPVSAARIQTPAASTHYRDTLKALGPPSRMSTAGSELVFLYEYTLLKEKQLGLSSNMEWLRLLKLSIGNAYAKRQAAFFIYDETGHLRAHFFREWVEDLGSGVSMQLIVSMVNVVDTDPFEVDAYQHMWGADLLKPRLAAGLNRQNSLESGQNGIELLATPEWAGQHMLEN